MIRRLKKVSRQLNKASRLHKKQSNTIKKIIKDEQKKGSQSRNRKKTKR